MELVCFQALGAQVRGYLQILMILPPPFIWAMGGENQAFDDMDNLKPTDLR